LTLEVVESPSGTPSPLLGDRAKIRQIVSALAGNAVKHTQSGGVLVEWGEAVDQDIEDALEARADSIRICISMCVVPLSFLYNARRLIVFRSLPPLSADFRPLPL
jgi:hypothetical protein